MCTIREEYGSGSLTTIANHRRALEEEPQIGLIPPDSGRPVMPDPVAQACLAGSEAVWRELMDAAGAVEAELTAAADAAIAGANALTEQAVARRDAAEAENSDLKQDLARLKRELEALATAHAELQTAYRDTGAEVAAQAKAIATLEADRRHLEETLAERREAHTAAMAGKAEEIGRLERLLTRPEPPGS